jgi:hypothetical protein
LDKAKALLKDAGYQDKNGDGVLEDKAGAPFEFKLTYFQANEEQNRKDGIYNSVPEKQRKSVTTALENQAVDAKDPNSPKLPTGLFQIVLGPQSDAKSTPGNGPANPKK